MKLNDAARDLIGDGTDATLVTLNADGSPQVTVVWMALESTPDGDELVSAHLTEYQKTRNIRRDPRVAVTILALGRRGSRRPTAGGHRRFRGPTRVGGGHANRQYQRHAARRVQRHRDRPRCDSHRSPAGLPRPTGSPRWINEGGPWKALVTVHTIQAPTPYAMAIAFAFDGVLRTPTRTHPRTPMHWTPCNTRFRTLRRGQRSTAPCTGRCTAPS
jgi:PPOX class probable F420-dependent enzyme